MTGKIAPVTFDVILHEGKTYLNKEQVIAWLLESAEMSDEAIKDTMVSLSRYLLKLNPVPK